MPCYEHMCTECQFEWEDDYSIKAAPPTSCPSCGKDSAKRLISGGSGKGIVVLSGQDLINKVKSDAAAIESHSSKSEDFASNFIGPDVYQRKQMAIDNAKRNGTFKRKGW